jgi:hypothetical protein
MTPAPPPLEPWAIHGVPDSPVWLVRVVLSVSVKVSNSSRGGMLGDAEAEGLVLALGLTDNDAEDEGLTDGDGDTEALGLLDGETDALGETLGLTDGEPTDATLRTSTAPPTLAEALLSVNDPLPTVVIASKLWSAHVTPCESFRSIQGLGAVKVGVASATQVSCTADLVEVRGSAGHVPLVDEALDCAVALPMGVVWSTFR